jgi:hypothetical protein
VLQQAPELQPGLDDARGRHMVATLRQRLRDGQARAKRR